MTEKKAHKILQVLIVVLILCLTTLGLFTYSFYGSSQEEIAEIQHQKNKLTQELTDLQNNYKAILRQNNTLKNSLNAKEQQVAALIDSLNQKKINQRLLQRYQLQASLLLQEKRQLAQTVDSLSLANKALKNKIDSSSINAKKQERLADSLALENKKLAQKIEETPTLQLVNFQLDGIRNSKTSKTTQKASKTKSIRLCFHSIKSPFYEAETERIYVQIINPKNNVIGNIQSTEIQGNVLRYSYRKEINISSLDQKQCLSVPTENLIAGRYVVNVFSGSQLLKSVDLKLD